MRTLSITNQLAFPSEKVRFQQTWYYLLSREQIKSSNTTSIISDRHLKFEHLPDRVESQFLLFRAQTIVLQLEYKNEDYEQLLDYLINFKNKLPDDTRIVLLPTQNLKVNTFLLKAESISSFYNQEEFQNLMNHLSSQYTYADNQKIFEYLKTVI